MLGVNDLLSRQAAKNAKKAKLEAQPPQVRLIRIGLDETAKQHRPLAARRKKLEKGAVLV
jgi:hypothetical protein